MLIRHFRLLLSAYSKENPIQERKRMLPWQSGKLDKQAGLFGETELKRLYAKLFQIEAKQKVGALPASVPTAIDFFIAAI